MIPGKEGLFVLSGFTKPTDSGFEEEEQKDDHYAEML